MINFKIGGVVGVLSSDSGLGSGYLFQARHFRKISHNLKILGKYLKMCLNMRLHISLNEVIRGRLKIGFGFYFYNSSEIKEK